jgi:diphthamide biosynthesis protein 2
MDKDFKDPNTKAFVWVGDANSPALTHALLMISSATSDASPFRTNYDVARYCPEKGEIEAKAIGTEACRRNVKKRNHSIERAKDSNIVGIVVGTLGVSGYLSVVSKLREMIESSGRTCYTVACGKPNPNKLANFPEIETFVLVACELCALVDGKDYLQAVITPYEAALAFGNKPWIGEIKLDFDSFEEETKDFDGVHDVRAEPTMSFLTGTLRKDASSALTGDDADDYDLHGANLSSTLMDEEDDEKEEGATNDAKAADALKLAERASQALTFRHENLHLNKTTSTPRSGAEYLLTKRTFVGLDPKKKVKNDNDDDEEGGGEHPLQAAEGRRGRAAAYDSVDINK